MKMIISLAKDTIFCLMSSVRSVLRIRGLQHFLNVFAEDPMKGSIKHIPCFAHMTNLVFIHAAKRSPFLAKIVVDVTEIVNVLRKTEARKEIGERRESICPRRWLETGFRNLGTFQC